MISIKPLALLAFLPFSALALEVTVNDITLHYDDKGVGDPVVFLHGAISDRRVWRDYQDAISSDRRFVSYDQRHFGDSISSLENASFSADSHADDLIKFVESLDALPVSVVSWSYGGDVAARASIRRPDLFKALVYYEPDINGLIDEVAGSNRTKAHLYEKFDPAFTLLEKGQNEEAAMSFIDVVFQLPAGGAYSESDDSKAIWMENSDTLPSYLSADAGNIATCESLGNLNIPSLIVTGETGFVYDAMMSDKLAQCLTNSKQVTLSEANHDGPYRKPEDFTNMIINFLDRIDNLQ